MTLREIEDRVVVGKNTSEDVCDILGQLMKRGFTKDEAIDLVARCVMIGKECWDVIVQKQVMDDGHDPGGLVRPPEKGAADVSDR